MMNFYKNKFRNSPTRAIFFLLLITFCHFIQLSNSPAKKFDWPKGNGINSEAALCRSLLDNQISG
jgi:heme A synthase